MAKKARFGIFSKDSVLAQDATITGEQYRVFFALHHYACYGGWIYETQTHIAKWAGINKHNFSRSLQVLKRKHIISVHTWITNPSRIKLRISKHIAIYGTLERNYGDFRRSDAKRTRYRTLDAIKGIKLNKIIGGKCNEKANIA